MMVGEINIKSDEALPTCNYCFLPWWYTVWDSLIREVQATRRGQSSMAQTPVAQIVSYNKQILQILLAFVNNNSNMHDHHGFGTSPVGKYCAIYFI